MIHNTAFGLQTLHDNLTHLKLFQVSVSSCLIQRPGNLLIHTIFFPSNFAFLAASFCFFKMAIACLASSFDFVIASSESFLVFDIITFASSAKCLASSA